jgi:hypothetical protein
MIDQAAILASALTALLPASVREERAPFVRDLSVGIVAASEEATCSGPWKDVECRRTWAGSTEELEAMVGTLGFWETAFLPRIQAGLCKKWGPRRQDVECDGLVVIDGRRVFKASTSFQIQGLTLDERREVTGLEPMALYEASRHAARVVAGHWNRCQVADKTTCTFTGLAGTLSFRQAPARTHVFHVVLEKLRG